MRTNWRTSLLVVIALLTVSGRCVKQPPTQTRPRRCYEACTHAEFSCYDSLIVVLLVLQCSRCSVDCAYLRRSFVPMYKTFVDRVSLNMNVVINQAAKRSTHVDLIIKQHFYHLPPKLY